MIENEQEHVASEQPAALTYGMSQALRDSGLLRQVEGLSHKDKIDLIRYIYMVDTPDANAYDELHDEQQPYTQEEINARIDEAEAEAERGEGKTFEEMMSGFKEQLLWLK